MTSLSGLCALLVPAALAAEPLPPPVEVPVAVAARFYNLLNEQRCTEAAALREYYDPTRCHGISDVEASLRVSPAEQTLVEALVSADVRYRRGRLPQHIVGCLRLRRRGAGWVIADWESRPCAQVPLTRAAGPAEVGAGAPATPTTLAVRPAGSQRLDALPDNRLRLERTPGIVPSATVAWPLQGALQTAPATTPPPASSRFGSERLLHACWSDQALRGLGNDTRIHKGLPVDRSGPDPAYIQEALAVRIPLRADWRNSIRSVRLADPGARVIALTFDLCEMSDEVTGYDGRIIDYLRQEGIPATFFAGGKWMRSHPERTQQLIADPLFELGNHAWTHGNLRVLTGEPLREQISWTQAEYLALRDELAALPCAATAGPTALESVPLRLKLFRFPYGACGPEALAATAEFGLAAIQWNLVTSDPWSKQTAAGIVQAVLRGVKPGTGNIAIMHANGRGWKTAEALPLMISKLREQHYDFVTVSTLLDLGKPVSPEDCYELRPGDNTHYDRLFGEGTSHARRR